LDSGWIGYDALPAPQQHRQSHVRRQGGWHMQSFFFIRASPAVAHSSPVSSLKCDQGAFSVQGAFTSDEDATTLFVVERHAKSRIRFFSESLDTVAWPDYKVQKE
jgi:hypothetical protein